jgi:Uma2 family endonuclease
MEELTASPGRERIRCLLRTVNVDGFGDLLASQVLPDLRLTVDDIFPEFDFARP